MDKSPRLDAISFPIEAAVCLLDRRRGFTMTDAQAIAIFELLIDRYVFGDPMEAVAARAGELGCEEVLELVDRELEGYDRESVQKVLAVVRFVACRRNRGGRDHLRLLHETVGAFVRTGVGLRRLSDGTDMVVGDLPDAPPRLSRPGDPGLRSA